MNYVTAATAEALAVGIIDATRLAGVGRSTIYDEIKAGRLKARKAGRRTLILRDDLQAWLNTLPARDGSHAAFATAAGAGRTSGTSPTT